MQFEGIYTPVITPYHNDFSLNHDALEATINRLIEAGVHGLIIAGTTGEYYAQTTEERIEMMSIAKEIIAGRRPMIVGTGAIRTEDSILYAKAAKTAGADALLIATPALCLPDRPRNCPTRFGDRPRRRSSGHALQLSWPDVRQYG